MSTEYWYRYDEIQYAPPVNEFDEPTGRGRMEVLLHRFPVIKHTPRGAWLGVAGGSRFVLRDARKRFACPTQEEALESFIRRKQRQVRILSAQCERAQAALEIGAEIKAGRQTPADDFFLDEVIVG